MTTTIEDSHRILEPLPEHLCILLTPGIPDPDGDKLFVSVSDEFACGILRNNSPATMIESSPCDLQPGTNFGAEFLVSLWGENSSQMPLASALGGHEGILNILNFVSREMPTSELDIDNCREAIDRAERFGHSYGPSLDVCARSGNPCCGTVLAIYGAVLDALIRALAANNPPTGGIFLVGRFMADEVARHLVRNSPLGGAHLDGSNPYGFMGGIPIYVSSGLSLDSEGVLLAS